jgi:hypothetical protein
MYAGMPTLAETLAELDDLGSELKGIFPVARDDDGLRVLELDGVLSRRVSTHPGATSAGLPRNL